MTRYFVAPLAASLAFLGLAFWWVVAPLDLRGAVAYYTWPVASAWAGVEGAGGVPPAVPAVSPSDSAPGDAAAPDGAASTAAAPPGAGSSPALVEGEAHALPLDLPALASAAGSAAVGYGAGAIVHAVARRRKGKRWARVLRAATPWAKLAVGTAVGALATSVLAGAALPAALVYGVAAGLSAIAGRQLMVKPINIARERA